jgi:hypothetical protein
MCALALHAICTLCRVSNDETETSGHYVYRLRGVYNGTHSRTTSKLPDESMIIPPAHHTPALQPDELAGRVPVDCLGNRGNCRATVLFPDVTSDALCKRNGRCS